MRCGAVRCVATCASRMRGCENSALLNRMSYCSRPGVRRGADRGRKNSALLKWTSYCGRPGARRPADRGCENSALLDWTSYCRMLRCPTRCGSRVRGFDSSESNVPLQQARCIATADRGCEDARVRECENARIREYENTRVRECESARIREFGSSEPDVLLLQARCSTRRGSRVR